MNISWLGTVWAAVKGAFSFGTTAKLSIVDYILDMAYEYYSNVEMIVANIAKAYNGLVTLCDKLDYYAKYIPAPWMSYYEAICKALYELRDMLADGRVERTEIERVVMNVKNAITVWHK